MFLGVLIRTRKSLLIDSGFENAVCAVWVQAGRLREPLLADLALLHDSSGISLPCFLELVCKENAFWVSRWGHTLLIHMDRFQARLVINQDTYK